MPHARYCPSDDESLKFMPMLKISDLDLSDQRVLIRADLNVPLMAGKISSDKRIQASIPTIQYAIDQGARVMVTSHLGCPQEGKFSEENSLQPIADYLRGHLGAQSGCNVIGFMRLSKLECARWLCLIIVDLILAKKITMKS